LLLIAVLFAALLSVAVAPEAEAARKRKKSADKPWPAPKPLVIERFTLSNGMRVVVQPDRRAPLVAMGLMVDVGSRDERSGRSGLAHFFEHMMFQGSQRVAKMEHFRALEAVGASLNANTSTDRTYYFEVLPVAALEMAMYMEADRFATLKINAANVENQRQTVMEERRQRYGNRPYAMSRLRFLEKAFTNWRLQHSTIGSMEDLKKTPVADFEAFWRKWYTPNNVVLTLVGDIDLARARKLAERYFGRLKRRAEPKHNPFTEPEPEAHSWHVYEEPLGQTPAFHMGWRVPARPHADAYAIEVLAQVLDGGEASRLTRKLARDTGLATRHFAGNHGRRDVDLFQVYVEMSKPGHKATAKAKAIVRGALQDIALKGVGKDELQRAKVAYEAGWVFGNLSFSGRAHMLATFELYGGDASKINDELARYRAITSDDLKRVARRYFGFAREIEMDVLPKGVGPAKGAGDKPKGVAKFEKRLAKAIAAEKKAEARRLKAAEKRRLKEARRAAKKAARAAAKKAKAEARERLRAKKKAAAEKAAADKAAARTAAEKAAADKAAAKAADEKAAADKAVADRALDAPAEVPPPPPPPPPPPTSEAGGGQ